MSNLGKQQGCVSWCVCFWSCEYGLCLMQVNRLRGSMVKAYFVEAMNSCVDRVYLDTLHTFWLWRARCKEVEGNIDGEARDAKA